MARFKVRELWFFYTSSNPLYKVRELQVWWHLEKLLWKLKCFKDTFDKKNVNLISKIILDIAISYPIKYVIKY